MYFYWLPVTLFHSSKALNQIATVLNQELVYFLWIKSKFKQRIFSNIKPSLHLRMHQSIIELFLRNFIISIFIHSANEELNSISNQVLLASHFPQSITHKYLNFILFKLIVEVFIIFFEDSIDFKTQIFQVHLSCLCHLIFYFISSIINYWG